MIRHNNVRPPIANLIDDNPLAKQQLTVDPSVQLAPLRRGHRGQPRADADGSDQRGRIDARRASLIGYHSVATATSTKATPEVGGAATVGGGANRDAMGTAMGTPTETGAGAG